MSLFYKSRDSPNISSIYPLLLYFIKNYYWSCLVTQEVKIRVKFIPILILHYQSFSYFPRKDIFLKYQFIDKLE